MVRDLLLLERNQQTFKLLEAQLQSGTGIIPFIGAGLSLPWGMPLWRDFLRDAAQAAAYSTVRCEQDLAAQRLEELADQLYESWGDVPFNDYLAQRFSPAAQQDPGDEDAMHILPELFRGPVFTTNFDHVLETVYAGHQFRFDQVCDGHDPTAMGQALNLNEHVLYKLHGDIHKPTHRILTLREYRSAYGGDDVDSIDHSRPWPALLARAFSTRSLLFLGASLGSDRTLRLLQHTVASAAKQAHGAHHALPFHYAILARPETPEERRDREKFFSSCRIRPIWFPRGQFSAIAAFLCHLLERAGGAPISLEPIVPRRPTPPPMPVLSLVKPPASPLPPPPPLDAATPMEELARLGLLCCTQVGRNPPTWTMLTHFPITIGTGRDSAILFPNPGVQTQHATLDLNAADEVQLTYAASAAPFRSGDGSHVSSGLVRSGCELQMGEVHITLYFVHPGLVLRWAQRLNRRATCIAWSPRASLVAYGTDTGSIYLQSTDDGTQVQHFAVEHSSQIMGLAWSGNGAILASFSKDGTVVCFKQDRTTSSPVPRFRSLQVHQRYRDVSCLSLSEDGDLLAIGTRLGAVLIHDLRTDSVVDSGLPRLNQIQALSWSYANRIEPSLAVGSIDGELCVLLVRRGEARPLEVMQRWPLQRAHKEPINCIAWAIGGQTHLALASRDRTITIWDPVTGRLLATLEGHLDEVLTIAFSADNNLLSRSASELRCWSWEVGQGKAMNLVDVTSQLPLGLRASSSGHTLAASGSPSQRSQVPPAQFVLASDHDTEHWLHCFSLRADTLALHPPEALHYSNAKVLLLGNSGVGKSALLLELSGQRFYDKKTGKQHALLSTHTRAVATMESVQEGNEHREIFVWDMAGQDNFRITHQLHLHNATVALLVVSASMGPPLETISYWSNALHYARPPKSANHGKVDGDSVRRPLDSEAGKGDGSPPKKLLVFARQDVSGMRLDPKDLERYRNVYQFEGPFLTSAVEHAGIDELIAAVKTSIPWEKLPRINSNVLFYRIRTRLLAKKQGADGVIFSESELLAELIKDLAGELSPKDSAESLRKKLVTCIDLMASHDLIYKFSFGDYVLLRPEYLDAYSNALIKAASESDGIVDEQDARNGRFNIPSNVQVEIPEDERLLLGEMITDLLKKQIAFRDTRHGASDVLVFPSQVIRGRPARDESELWAHFSFSGPTTYVYTRLIINLSAALAEGLSRKELWHNAADFWIKDDRCLTLLMNESNFGSEATLALYCDKETGASDRDLFFTLIERYLRWMSVVNLKVRRIPRCPGCERALSPTQFEDAFNSKLVFLWCAYCDPPRKVLVKVPDVESANGEIQRIRTMEAQGVERLDQAVVTATLRAKEAVGEYDALVAFSEDPELAQGVNQQLRSLALRLWLAGQSLSIPALSVFEEAKSLGITTLLGFLVNPSGLDPGQPLAVALQKGLAYLGKTATLILITPSGVNLVNLPRGPNADAFRIEAVPFPSAEDPDALRCLTQLISEQHIRISAPTRRVQGKGVRPLLDAPPSGSSAERRQSAQVSHARGNPARHGAPIWALHLSDLHFHSNQDIDVLFESLRQDLEISVDRGGMGLGKLDLLLVSGGLTECGDKAEFRTAEEFITRLVSYFSIAEGARIVVPGSHDISRSFEVYNWRHESQLPAELDPIRHVRQGGGRLIRDENAYPLRMHEFASSYQRLVSSAYPLDAREQGQVFLLPELRLQIIALNSCSQIDEHFPNRAEIHDGALARALGMADQQLREAREADPLCEERSFLRLAVFHHPPTLHIGAQGGVMEKLVRAGVSLCLHGQSQQHAFDGHDPLPLLRNVHSVGAGILGSPPSQSPEAAQPLYLYNVLEFAPDLRSVKIHTRHRTAPGSPWRGMAVWPGNSPEERRTFYVLSLV